jgi:hypothetical protein
MDTTRLPLVCLAALALFPVAASAQTGKGSYAGTATIQSTEVSGKNSRQLRATVKVALPVTSTGGSIMAEVDDIDKPSATATITELSIAREESSRGTDGKFATLSCKLSRAVEMPLNAQGAITVDTRAKTYTVTIAMVGLKQVPLDCVHSQSGAHKRQEGVSIAIATHDPSAQPTGLTYSDPAKLAAKHKLTIKGSGGETSSLDQEWDFQLKR